MNALDKLSFNIIAIIVSRVLSCTVFTSGGGFRDSISDIAEELCPSSMANFQSVPLPYFVRSPNQVRDHLLENY